MPEIKIPGFLQAMVATDHLVSNPPQIEECERVFGFHPSFQARVILTLLYLWYQVIFLSLIVDELATSFSSYKLSIWGL